MESAVKFFVDIFLPEGTKPLSTYKNIQTDDAISDNVYVGHVV